MYTSKDIAEAIENIPADDLDVTAIAWCDLHDRITRETGLSEEAVRQMMKKECLLWIEKMRQKLTPAFVKDAALPTNTNPHKG